MEEGKVRQKKMLKGSVGRLRNVTYQIGSEENINNDKRTQTSSIPIQSMTVYHNYYLNVCIFTIIRVVLSSWNLLIVRTHMGVHLLPP